MQRSSSISVGRAFLHFSLLVVLLIFLYCSALVVMHTRLLLYQHVALRPTLGLTFPISFASTNANTSTTTKQYREYIPASSEDFIMNHFSTLDLDVGRNTSAGSDWVNSSTSSGCNLWKNPEVTTNETYEQLHAFRRELKEYYRLVNEFPGVKDVRLSIQDDHDDAPHHEVCERLELVAPGGLSAIFPSRQLSFTRSGYVEPLLPPMRLPDFCFRPKGKLLRLQYLVHDFAYMCRSLKKHSRIILVDMGASLNFHGQRLDSPAIYLTEIYRKFGMPFDHIYAYELKQEDPNHVFERLPQHLQAAYHWINVGVSAERDSPLNPFRMLLENYTPDDLIVVKMDIDGAQNVEQGLTQQLLEDERLHELVDHFYYEHHVHMTEIKGSWKRYMSGSIQESLELFSGIRKAGVASHFWV